LIVRVSMTDVTAQVAKMRERIRASKANSQEKLKLRLSEESNPDYAAANFPVEISDQKIEEILALIFKKLPKTEVASSGDLPKAPAAIPMNKIKDPAAAL